MFEIRVSLGSRLLAISYLSPLLVTPWVCQAACPGWPTTGLQESPGQVIGSLLEIITAQYLLKAVTGEIHPLGLESCSCVWFECFSHLLVQRTLMEPFSWQLRTCCCQLMGAGPSCVTLATLLTCTQMGWESAWSQVRLCCCSSEELPFWLILSHEHLHVADLQATARGVSFIGITVTAKMTWNLGGDEIWEVMVFISQARRVFVRLSACCIQCVVPARNHTKTLKSFSNFLCKFTK